MGVPSQVEEAAVETPPEVLARLCTFDGGELRWAPQNGEAIKVELVRLVGGARSLILGDKKVKLADVRAASLLCPTFMTLQVKEMGHIGLQCEQEKALANFAHQLMKSKADYERFEQYESGSVQSYFQYYSKLGNQQNMLQDAVRTNTYREAIVSNPTDFQGATVMDIGAGSGILSFFSAQAGAAVVYAVEASSAAETIRALAEANKFNLGGAEICVVNKPLETISDEVPSKVDLLVSEPIGTFLFNERMIETYLCARDRFLKPGGKMFPNVGNLCIAPFSDAVLHGEQQGKNAFWKNTSFYGIDLTAAVPRSTKEHFTQPVVDYINPDCLVSEYITTRFDFTTITVESLHRIEIPFDFPIHQPCLVHGIAGWFDAVFEGSNATVTLSTAPWCPGTHWYQIRFLLETPLAVNAGQRIEGYLRMEANNLQSYHIRIHMQIAGTTISSDAHCIDLKDPEYRFFTSASTYVPPGTAGVFGQQAADPAAAAAAALAAQQAQAQAWAQAAAVAQQPLPQQPAPQQPQPQQQTLTPQQPQQPPPRSPQQRPWEANNGAFAHQRPAAAQVPSCRGTARSRSASRRVR